MWPSWLQGLYRRLQSRHGQWCLYRAPSHGVTTDITPDATQAVTKLKATATQQVVIDGLEMDAEADCRFCFFFEKADVDGKGPRWGARFARHWYEKDTLLPVVPGRLPKIDVDKLNSYPDSYKCLAYC